MEQLDCPDLVNSGQVYAGSGSELGGVGMSSIATQYLVPISLKRIPFPPRRLIQMERVFRLTPIIFASSLIDFGFDDLTGFAGTGVNSAPIRTLPSSSSWAG